MIEKTDEIAYGARLHLKTYPGDHGIRFEKLRPGEQMRCHLPMGLRIW